MTIETLQRFFSANQHKLRLVLVAALACLCVWFVFLSLRAFLFPGPLVYAEINLPNPARNTVRWNWFTAATVAEVAPQEEEEELAVANINAELLGVVVAGDDSVATIAVSRQDAKVFRVGDDIDRNVSLEEVSSTRVVISQNGVRRQIPLKDVTGNANRNNTGENSLIQVNPSSSNSGAGFSMPGVGSTTPIQVPGEGMGLRLSNVSSDIADLADLQDGDVILNISGTPVSDLFSNPLLWQQFSQETSLPMTVLRGGEQEEVFVNAASLFEKIIPQLGAGLIQ